MTAQTEKRSYKKTINAPRTSFPMKANLVQNEPATQKRWRADGLYDKVRQARAGGRAYMFHDGPPYANGSIHLGHLLNKVLKDLVVRTRTMAGLDCAYVPGWDCHGLPIEHKVMQDLGEKAKQMSPMQIRRRCRATAEQFVKLQAGQMQRLLTLADYDAPYLTMAPSYEAATLKVFAELVERGLVYRDLKPVHWSIANQTALAEAELEYYDREDLSVYVLFEIEDAAKLPASLNVPGGEPVHLMIWTTTPWTLPANMATAVHERFEYGLHQFEHEGRTRLAILASELGEKVTNGGRAIGTASGSELTAATYCHPFIERSCPIVLADYVTLEDGTGLVHTAPGHGTEDYITGLREGLEIYCPVQDDGTFDDTAPSWLHGVDVWRANDLVVDRLRASGHLFHAHQFTHSYPHDWRSKTPVIFRATQQWFVGVDRPIDGSGDTLRKLALTCTADGVRFVPDWGRNRMRGMLESRPDWCLSRQRAWGLPIPAFFDEVSREYLLTPSTVRAVADKVREQGSDCWFTAEPGELLADYDAANDAAAPSWAAEAIAAGRLSKSSDIFDVWFESGSSWNAVMRQRFGDGGFPTDLYLEGSDQHRGWFQLSLLPSLGVTGQAPFRTVLTHGFMVGKDGHALSKSKGHTIEGLFEQYGADVLRWWVSTLNFENDIKVDDEFFDLAGEEYRKVRNTLRFLLSNLADFTMADHKVRFEDDDASSIDAWITGALIELSDTVQAAYEAFEFRRANEAMFNFCNETLSAVYLMSVKDRLYCDRPDSHRRRRTQTTLYRIATTLIRLLAPILPHTADEAWAALEGDTAGCVHLEPFQDADCMRHIPVEADWTKVMAARVDWMKAIETFRQSNNVDNPLDVGIRLSDAYSWLDAFDPVDLADLCGISQFIVEALDGDAGDSSADAGNIQLIDLRNEPRCDRSWKRDGTVRQRSDGGMLSDRDAEALGF